MTLFTDRVEGGIERALQGVSMRQRVTADNLANAMTPGYTAKRVEFEATLGEAMRTGRAASAPVSQVTTTDAAKLDGNNVNVEQEVIEQQRTGLQYQALVEAANHKLGLLKTAIESR
jgi:flagellar basal-body rod protein FlgB